MTPLLHGTAPLHEAPAVVAGAGGARGSGHADDPGRQAMQMTPGRQAMQMTSATTDRATSVNPMRAGRSTWPVSMP